MVCCGGTGPDNTIHLWFAVDAQDLMNNIFKVCCRATGHDNTKYQWCSLVAKNLTSKCINGVMWRHKTWQYIHGLLLRQRTWQHNIFINFCGGTGPENTIYLWFYVEAKDLKTQYIYGLLWRRRTIYSWFAVEAQDLTTQHTYGLLWTWQHNKFVVSMDCCGGKRPVNTIYSWFAVEA